MDGWRMMTLLMVSTGDKCEADDTMELRVLLLLVLRWDRRELEENDVRRPEGVKRAVRDWKRGDCILSVLTMVGIFGRGS